MTDENPGKKKIMVVDDDEDIVKIIKIVFEEENYSVIAAYRGKECLDKLAANEKPDIILIDIMMAGMSGYDLYAKIKENGEYKDMKIAFFSVKARAEDIEKGLAMGADDYITKPFDPYELVERVNKILENDKAKGGD